MKKHHSFLNDSAAVFETGKAVCIGRNYADHIKELDNPVPTQPLLFIKPRTSFSDLDQGIHLPEIGGDCHYETEVAILIGKTFTKSSQHPIDHIVGVGMALDLTMRDVQSKLKTKGYPWEIAKAFDGSCPISPFIPIKEFPNLNVIAFELKIDGAVRQNGQTELMITSIEALMTYAAQYFTLLPGDILLTGTPAGVGTLKAGAQLDLSLDHRFHFKSWIHDH